MPKAKTRRVEGPAERRGRLRRERVLRVRATPEEKWKKRLLGKLAFNRIRFQAAYARIDGCLLTFKSRGRTVGYLDFSVRKRFDKAEAVIEAVQGAGRGLEDAQKAFIDRFRMINKKPFSVMLAQSFVDAAYKAGFDRVLLGDIEATYD